jgi:hypothetical protein
MIIAVFSGGYIIIIYTFCAYTFVDGGVGKNGSTVAVSLDFCF